MAGIFTIAPTNSFSFVKSDTLLPNFDNTQYENWEELGIAKRPFTQKIIDHTPYNIQIKSDYTGIWASFYNITTNETLVAPSPAIKKTYTDFKIWEISGYLSIKGVYKLIISGSKLGYEDITYVSEAFEVVDSFDGLNIEWYNDDNTIYVDYSTGITHSALIPGIVRFSDVGGKDELYNNFGKEVLISSENDTLFDIICEGIPYYLVQKLIYASRMQHFFVNDCEYVRKESNVDAIAGCQLYNLTLKMSKANVQGINNESETQQKVTDTYTLFTSGFTITAQDCYHFNNDNNIYYDLTLHGLSSTPVDIGFYVFINSNISYVGKASLIEDTACEGKIKLPFKIFSKDTIAIKIYYYSPW